MASLSYSKQNVVWDSNIQTTFLSINSSRFRDFYLFFSTISVILVNRKNQEVRDGNQLQSAVETVDRPWFEQNRHDAPCKISTNVLARLSKGEPVSMDSMEKICTVLGCNIGDVMEFTPDAENGGIDA